MNSDGNIDIFFGPKMRAGNEANSVPTTPDTNYWLYFRFYGPEPAVFTKSWQLPDLEEVRWKGPLDYLYIHKDPGTYGQLTPNTVVQYIVNFYDYEKLGPMVMELPGKQIIQMAEDFTWMVFKN